MSRVRPRWRSRVRDERGSAMVFVLGMAVTMLVCAGLVLDGGNALNARMRLADNVEQAARAGAQQIDVDHLRTTGQVRLEPGAAETRARSFISTFNYPDVSVTVQDGQITVRAADSVETTLLGLVGIQEYDVAASATSTAVTR